MKTSFFFLLPLVLTQLTLFPRPNVATSALVDQVCNHSHNKDNCIESLDSNPDSKQANLQQLGVIAIKLAAENATDTSLHIKKMLNDTSLDAAVEQALLDCSEQYVDANQLLDNSVVALLSNAQEDVRTWVGAAIADAESCEDGLKENGGEESLLTARNAIFRQLCNNILAINKLLSH